MLFKCLRFVSHHHNRTHHFPSTLTPIRTFVDDVEINYVRDRGLDHAVEREKDLKPLINIKNLLSSEPSKSLPLSTIASQRSKLEIPYRPIDFIRKYGSVFEEHYPGNVGVHPHVKLSKESLDLDAEEQMVYASEACRKSAADRLLKLLMLCRVNEVPIKMIDGLRWDLGLPGDYVESLVPEFPDYFKVVRRGGVGRGSRDGVLELVCWSDELAVSEAERRAREKGEGSGVVGFQLQYSKGFEMDKRIKKWINDWQKLPYVSPYEDATHLQPSSDESDKWAVAVMHEFLSILVPKKTEREILLGFGEYLGIRSRFKRALVHHPGIFYLSSKIGTYTVVLREGYKRGLLVDKHPLMDMRSKYIHLMHTVKEGKNAKSGSAGDVSKKPAVGKKMGSKGKQEKGDEKVRKVEDEDEKESDEDDDEEEEMERKGRRGGRGSGKRGTKTANVSGGKTGRSSRQGRFRKPHPAQV